MRDDVWLAVLADMQARRAKGIATYRKTVNADDDLENWMRHLMEELLDAVVYLKAELMRRDKPTEGE